MTHVAIVTSNPADQPWKSRHRIEFRSEQDALEHRARVGCGGWVLGRFLYPGVEWTPSEIMLDCPDQGKLK